MRPAGGHGHGTQRRAPFPIPPPVLVGGPWREEGMRASAWAFLFDKTEAKKSRRRESERANPSFGKMEVKKSRRRESERSSPSFLSGHCSDFPFSGRKGRGIFGKCVPLAATAMATRRRRPRPAVPAGSDSRIALARALYRTHRLRRRRCRRRACARRDLPDGCPVSGGLPLDDFGTDHHAPVGMFAGQHGA